MGWKDPSECSGTSCEARVKCTAAGKSISACPFPVILLDVSNPYAGTPKD